jgi:hypothetical protein
VDFISSKLWNRVSLDGSALWFFFLLLLLENIGHLSDTRKVYLTVNLLQKQELIRTVFDNSLYYEKNVYRTPYLIPELAHNELIMKEKNLLIIEKKEEILQFPPQVEVRGFQSNT